MKIEKMFPLLMIVLSLWACIMYFIAKDYKRALYWLFAAGITATVTF